MNNSSKDTVKPIDIITRRLRKRYRAEKRFKFYGILAIFISLLFLLLLFVSIIGNGYSAFQQTYVQLEIHFDPALIDKNNLAAANFPGLVKQTLRDKFPGAETRSS